MFSYYGSKSKIVDYYPPPRYDKIIEPFAGSARYSLKYWDRHVFLYDMDRTITDTWNWLKDCSVNDILSLPVLNLGESLDDYNLTKEEKLFMGFIVQKGTTGKRLTVSRFANIRQELKRIGSNIHKIKNWTIIEGDYRNIKNQECTWFIDPPYQYGGHEYRFSNKLLDFGKLADWCKSREGQVIVCENTKANWMDFVPMVDMKGCAFTTTEAIWTNLPTSYKSEQTNLF